LQPVQLVSITATPGEIEKTPFEGWAVMPPPLQPATSMTSSIAHHRRPHSTFELSELSFECGNALGVFRKKTSGEEQLSC
jgi:hypothetical protein